MTTATLPKPRGRPRLTEEEKAARRAAKAAQPRKKPGPKPKASKAKTKKPAPTARMSSEGLQTPEVKDTPRDEVEKILARYRGRPTKFEARFCDMVILWGTLGKSKAWISAELMISRQTLDNWIAENPAFLDAMEISQRLAQKWWEDKGQNNLGAVGFQQSMYSRSMSARFPQDWTERRNTSLTIETHEEALARLAAETVL